VSIHIPIPASETGTSYVRLQYRRQMEIAVVGSGVAVTLTDGMVTRAAVAIAALAPTIHRVEEAEAALVGTDGNPGAVEAAANAASAAARPIGDVRASTDYRRAMAAVITRRAVKAALARARGETVAIPASESTYGS
jgi:carbon-monoxide dehydrogenase medium subunit